MRSLFIIHEYMNIYIYIFIIYTYKYYIIYDYTIDKYGVSRDLVSSFNSTGSSIPFCQPWRPWLDDSSWDGLDRL
jgi:hypothetical protein